MYQIVFNYRKLLLCSGTSEKRIIEMCKGVRVHELMFRAVMNWPLFPVVCAVHHKHLKEEKIDWTF
jgi:hypothetical protein